MNAVEKSNVLIFAIHRTVDWWKHIGQNLGLGKSVVVTDLAGEGDVSIVADFYRELRRLRAQLNPDSGLLSPHEVSDVIARCRTLRWQDRRLAAAMVHAMATVLDRVLESARPQIVLSFPIDRYVKDVLERMACARGIAYFELTASVVPEMAMLLHRGRLLQVDSMPNAELLNQKRRELVDPVFVPTYVLRKSSYGTAKFVRTYGYFWMRAIAFKLISRLKRDPLNLHYLDAQPSLGHKNRLEDIRILRMCDQDWRMKLDAVPVEKRVLFGLQLFPEAAIDYWIRSVDLIDHENIVVEAASAYSKAGYTILVKDHPLQFGFRQVRLLERLTALPKVIVVPYDVSGNDLLAVVGTNFTFTGTLGLQAALAGLKSVVTDSYYSNDSDFIVFRTREEIEHLPARTMAHCFKEPLEHRQNRMVAHLLRGSFFGDFFSFKGFDSKRPAPQAQALAAALGSRLRQLLAEGRLSAPRPNPASDDAVVENAAVERASP